MSLVFNPRLLARACKQSLFAVPARSITLPSSPDAIDNSSSDVPQSIAGISPLSTKRDQHPASCTKNWAERLDGINSKSRLPRSVQAVYLRPLRRKAEYGLPVCDLQLRSYSVRNVEFFADFAVRAAYYLKLPVSGPVPLPRIVERWTFPRSNFVHKKSQENFERITLRRLIQIKDGNPEAVQTWLAFLRKHAFYGVGMKANVWEHESLDVFKNIDKAAPEVERSLEPHLSHFGQRSGEGAQSSIPDLLGGMRLPKHRSPLSSVRKG
ncbi:mitochondrial 37S ribosomal protein RSM10 [Aspergillus nomiae NRRL 13137]|uniref:Small ribosomal subunit protein uS10m n=1 Tax=Aspergillus nomiae NRRL (strain ATCC 15546 / NRRL 13137 / CBS 260.88 / M93) TaxID=1509407 RepID=A0A0L1IKR8_ASPN3|nr:mitochondrial 37S ribosomal protein RSM10 [Aspergillus nomiae NRRL 13137]KNG80102.1 mitochondrial 37S ribosomal protein RSM10 [Aspergillus nomiae NRRL 13137]